MGRYYNKTRASLSVILHGGGSIAIPSKQWATIPASDENSSSIASAIRKGFLVRSNVSEVAPLPTDPVSPPVAVIEVPPTPVVTSIVITEDPKIVPIEVVAEIAAVVQNQPPKTSFLSKPSKASKYDTEEALTDEPRRKKE